LTDVNKRRTKQWWSKGQNEW